MMPYFLVALVAYCFAVPWKRIHRSLLLLWLFLPLLFLVLFQGGYLDEILARHFTGPLLFHKHGSGWSAIGWHKVLRNLLNVPVSVVMGLGLIAFCCLFPGVRALLARTEDARVWLVFLSVLAFSIFLAWPALLGLDMVSDYHLDPRKQIREWYAEVKPQRVFMSYFVNPPAEYAPSHRIFSPDYARFYRQALAGEHPYLAVEKHYAVQNFMPELVLHKWLYGTFQMFVGDVIIFKIGPNKTHTSQTQP